MNNNYESWQESDIQKYIDLEISENMNLEYKKEILLKGKKGKKELCKDISSFSNSQGGLLIIGLEEGSAEGGGSIPIKLCPITNLDIKENIQKVLLDGIKPLIDFRIWPIPAGLGNGEYILVEVPRSLRGIHMVTLGSDNRYYKRHDFESRPMNPYEIEDSYKQYLSIEENVVEKFGNLPDESQNIYPCGHGISWMSIKVIPRFESGNMFVPLCEWSREKFLSILNEQRKPVELTGIENFKPVYEGLRASSSFTTSNGEKKLRYQLTLFRSGSAVFGYRFGNQGDNKIYPYHLILKLHGVLHFMSTLYTEIGYHGPFDINVSWSNISDLSPTDDVSAIALSFFNRKLTTNIFEHRFMTNPKEVDTNLPKTIHPVLDHFWQSFGLPKCTWYHEGTDTYISQISN